MSELSITLLRVQCEEVTDDFLEGITDEFGWRLTQYDAQGGSRVSEQIPMDGLGDVAAGSEHVVDRELCRIGPDCDHACLEFWDRDTFSEDDLLGRIEIVREKSGDFTVRPSLYAKVLEDGSFNLTGHMGDYTVWLSFDET